MTTSSGAIVTDDPRTAERARYLINQARGGRADAPGKSR
ncbi:hypothetical protein [Actinomadura rudentiformis]|uniref:Uncharacterized protein n=1 Tax=Actinomadura rudentiformis TaxID=359158 RepID=A0A6H9ZAV3_9ACTN|nr:hypothetical protein F8566_02740 [Actinomadura rudentiformis]